MGHSSVHEPYNKNGSFTFKKSGVFYFVRRVPRDLERFHTTRRISFSLRTRSQDAAVVRARELAARLDRHWHDLRMQHDTLLSRYLRTAPEPSEPRSEARAGESPAQQTASATPAPESEALPVLSDAVGRYAALTGRQRPHSFHNAVARVSALLVKLCGDMGHGVQT
ncbi:DUF6538 domain-containing protein [Cereibacter sphaeroides f. sp. denitrificans]